jgi:hypothetical protein
VCAGDDERLVVAVQGRGHAAAVGRLVGDQVGLPASRVIVMEVDELPRLANGKPDYVAVAGLAPLVPDGESRPGNAAGRRAAIRTLYAEAVGRRVADDESFVDAGGDSLSYVELSIGLEDVLGALPADWHTRPLGDLLCTPPARRRPVSRVETSVVLRAVSILLIVGAHTTLWSARGGAHVLLAVAGFNFAQFRLAATGGLWRSIARIALPSMAWIGLAAAIGDQLEWRHVFLVNHLFGGADPRVAYWFIESIVAILAVVGLVLTVPAVRRLERRNPYGAALTVAAVGLAIRFHVVGPFSEHHSTSRPETVLWLFALGWAGALASTLRRRLLVSALLLPGVWGFWGAQPLREAIVAGATLLLLWVPGVLVPRPLHRAIGAVAAASLALYLTHWQVYPPLLRAFGPWVAFAGSVAGGLAVWLLYERLPAALRSILRIRTA